MKDEKYNGFKNYLNNHLDAFPSEYELDELIGYAIKTDAWESNEGYRKDRIEHCEREKAFHDQWLKENIPHSWINNGHGILQDLFIERDGFLESRRIVEHITNRDRYIVATIIQWLGTNCGMCFLGEALERFGARIVYDKKLNNEQNVQGSDNNNRCS
jgi:hypothetical protein